MTAPELLISLPLRYHCWENVRRTRGGAVSGEEKVGNSHANWSDEVETFLPYVVY